MEVQVEARNLEVRKAWHDKISDEKEKLIRHHPGLVHRLRVTIEGTTHKGGGYELLLVASIPNDTVVVKRKGEAVKPLLGDAFDTLGLQLKELQRKRRQSGKISSPGDMSLPGGLGVIKSLFPYESYGFISKPNGQDIYFHENSLKDVTMEQLAEGDQVKFGEAEGDKGPCAAWVRVVSK